MKKLTLITGQSTHVQKKMILFVEMKDSVEEDLKPPEHRRDLPSPSVKDTLVSFLPNKICCDTQGSSFHPSLKAIPLKTQPTNSTGQSLHDPLNPQPRFYQCPQTTCLVAGKKQMTMGLFHSPAEQTIRIRRDKPQPVTSPKLSQDSQPEDETVFRQRPLFPNHSAP